jgi:8-amino-7-oxononanoate synthase
MYEQYKKHLVTLDDRGQYRRLPKARQESKKTHLDFSTNDYLGLSGHIEIIEASIAATNRYGVGSTGSRLLSGNTSLHEALECKIAKSKNTQQSLMFNSGFQANFSTLAALLDRRVLGAKPIVFFDKFNHSSLYQAIFLSRPDLIRYRHNDIEDLEALLDHYACDLRPKFIVTETVFGMDGDVLPLERILLLAKKYQAFLYLDEAHATGVLGPQGYGLSTTVDLTEVEHVLMGTFSKALGSSGGYIACSAVIKDYLINKASGFIYSTSAAPAVIGATLKAWELVETLSLERNKLKFLGDLLRDMLQKEGYDIGHSSTHIIPIMLKEENASVKAKDALLKHGIKVSAIRPPTVPPHSSRIRIALTAHHEEKDLQTLLAGLMSVL